MMTVRFPEMRAEARGAVRALADRAYQERVWLQKKYPSEKFYDDFTTNSHILYDDTQVLSSPESVVGDVVHENEIGSLRRLAEILDPLIDDLGGQPDSAYLADPRWAEVVQAAAEAERVMAANEPPA